MFYNKHKDHFKEESVSQKKAGFRTLLFVLCNIGMIVFSIIAITIVRTVLQSLFNIIPALIAAGLAFLCFHFKDKVRIEYDYTFTNGKFDVAKIFNGKKRKRIISLDVEKIEILEHTSEPGFTRMINHQGLANKYNCFINAGAGLYYAVFNKSGTRNILVFEPSVEMLELFKLYNPNNIKIKNT